VPTAGLAGQMGKPQGYWRSPYIALLVAPSTMLPEKGYFGDKTRLFSGGFLI